ncbi:MOSC domain-containing protein [Litoribrevibacter albus]|uniref:Molybdenum cofactor sulfurase n=1 Tax=Litoribrevibacter albus TaxID=1473156 RepID=A0AA37W760_9GAMM|nr:MOSC domain-containing protein [Litoribrevibacter albus]GLQ30839.1 molybdenum cofactor sulfurase [Litoribrevibacter albus]
METQTQSVLIDHLLMGKTQPFGPKGEPSGIHKTQVSEVVSITFLGFAGDEQGDLRVHGGREKAIHHYPREHYQSLQPMFPSIEFAVGGFGENMSSHGLLEKDVCLGDIFQFGTAKLQVSQGRQPCWKLNERFGDKAMAKTIQKQGLTGWYYRVLEEGEAKAGDTLMFLERVSTEANLHRVMHCLHRDPLNIKEMEVLVDVPEIPEGWRNIFRKRLAKGQVEDMSGRLIGAHAKSV